MFANNKKSPFVWKDYVVKTFGELVAVKERQDSEWAYNPCKVLLPVGIKAKDYELPQVLGLSYTPGKKVVKMMLDEGGPITIPKEERVEIAFGTRTCLVCTRFTIVNLRKQSRSISIVGCYGSFVDNPSSLVIVNVGMAQIQQLFPNFEVAYLHDVLEGMSADNPLYDVNVIDEDRESTKVVDEARKLASPAITNLVKQYDNTPTHDDDGYRTNKEVLEELVKEVKTLKALVAQTEVVHGRKPFKTTIRDGVIVKELDEQELERTRAARETEKQRIADEDALREKFFKGFQDAKNMKVAPTQPVQKVEMESPFGDLKTLVEAYTEKTLKDVKEQRRRLSKQQVKVKNFRASIDEDVDSEYVALL